MLVIGSSKMAERPQWNDFGDKGTKNVFPDLLKNDCLDLEILLEPRIIFKSKFPNRYFKTCSGKYWRRVKYLWNVITCSMPPNRRHLSKIVQLQERTHIHFWQDGLKTSDLPFDTLWNCMHYWRSGSNLQV